MRDTCPFDPGRDPIFNYMNYGFDSCLFEWTQGQINIMHATIEYYRQASRRELASIELLSGVESDDVSLVEGVGRYFYMNVRNTSLIACQTFSDNGDIDIFANWDGKLNSFECISNGLDSRELCILGPDQGRIYLWVEAYSTTIDFTVKCSPITVRRREELFDNIAKQSICFSPNELQPYFFSTPDTALSFVKCETDGEGDPDLFLGNSDSIKDPVCESRTFGSAIEACQIGPLKGNISVWILSSDHSENVTIHCKATPLDGIELTSGVTSNTMNVLADEEITFYVHTGNDQPSMVYCTTTCDNGDLDLYMSWNRAALECVSASLASYEECEMGPDVGIALAYVYGYEDTFNFSITCSVDYIPVFVLSDGDVAGPFHVKLHEYKFFELFVPKPSFVTCSTTGLDGDLDLYMNYDGSASNHICSSETYSSNENCTIGRRSGKTYAYVYGNAPNTNFNITCSILDEDTNWL